jgi:formylglycine-generating enzyme required for sulfatase activity
MPAYTIKQTIKSLLLTSIISLTNPSSAEITSTASSPDHSIPSAMAQKLLDEMILVEGGSFMMGSDETTARKREGPAHKVTLDDFYIGKTEVTQALFEQLMGWNLSYFNCSDCPVNNISWFNVQLFITRLNQTTGKTFRLPTEAEWEYAAKGGKYSKGYRYSGSNNINDVAWYADNANNKSHRVAQKQPNELGLYDMTGNLWEWCHDDMNPSLYTSKERTNPLYLKSNNPQQKSMKVLRGSGYEFSATESPVYARDGSTNNVRLPDIGFRLAMSKN